MYHKKVWYMWYTSDTNKFLPSQQAVCINYVSHMYHVCITHCLNASWYIHDTLYHTQSWQSWSRYATGPDTRRYAPIRAEIATFYEHVPDTLRYKHNTQMPHRPKLGCIELYQQSRRIAMYHIRIAMYHFLYLYQRLFSDTLRYTSDTEYRLGRRYVQTRKMVPCCLLLSLVIGDAHRALHACCWGEQARARRVACDRVLSSLAWSFRGV